MSLQAADHQARDLDHRPGRAELTWTRPTELHPPLRVSVTSREKTKEIRGSDPGAHIRCAAGAGRAAVLGEEDKKLVATLSRSNA